MSVERIDDFVNRVRRLKEWGHDYEGLYGSINSLFREKSTHVRGAIDIPWVQGEKKGATNLIVDIAKREPLGNGFSLELSMSLGKNNLRKVYETVLPNPNVISIDELEGLGGDEILQTVVDVIDRNPESAQKSFRNVRRKKTH